MNDQESDIFILCADHRIHIWSAVKRQGLLIPGRKFDKLSAYGAQIYLAYPDDLPNDYAWLSHQLRFGSKTFPPPKNCKKRVVFIGHRKCGYYFNVKKRPTEDEERHDILTSANTARKILCNNVEVEAYYAIRDEKHEISLDPLMKSAVTA